MDLRNCSGAYSQRGTVTLFLGVQGSCSVNSCYVTPETVKTVENLFLKRGVGQSVTGGFAVIQLLVKAATCYIIY